MTLYCYTRDSIMYAILLQTKHYDKLSNFNGRGLTAYVNMGCRWFDYWRYKRIFIVYG